MLGEAQEIINGGFEEWEVVDGVEEPVGWGVRNPECCITTEKTVGYNDIGHAIRLKTSHWDFEGYNTEIANYSFIPAFTYQYLHADIWVERIDPGGKARIVVLEKYGDQYFVSVGWKELYEEVGVWEMDTVTSGFISVTIPIEQKTFDKIDIGLWAETTITGLGSDGYCSMVVDNVRLSPDPIPVQENEITIFPNPSTDYFKAWWPKETNVSTIRVLTILGQVVYEEYLLTDDATFVEVAHEDWAWGTYIVQLLDGDKVIHNGKLIVRE